MMNVLALGLVLTSLLTAGFFTPTPETQKPPPSKDDVIVKEGHRVVVVEFEKEDGHTKVLISPQDSEKGSAVNSRDDLSEKMVVGGGGEEEEEKTLLRFKPRELVCDAYGKCKHKIASALGRTKEAVAEKVHEVEEEAKEAVSETIGKVKDTVTHTAHQAFDKMHESKESVKESASEAKDKVVEKAGELKEGAEKVKDDVEANASRKIENAKQGVERVKNEGKKELSEIMHRAREVTFDVFDYIFSSDRIASLTGVLHLMGFAAAYGMCVWVTFASSYVLARALPRHQFGMVQSKIYLVYFKAMAYSVGAAILGHWMRPAKSLAAASGVGMFRGFSLVASLAMILVNLLYLEPRANKVMLERMKKEKEEGQPTEASLRVVDSTAETAGRVSRQEKQDELSAAAAKAELARLSEKLQRLNSYSSFLNVSTLMSLTWHLVHLGQCLHAVS